MEGIYIVRAFGIILLVGTLLFSIIYLARRYVPPERKKLKSKVRKFRKQKKILESLMFPRKRKVSIFWIVIIIMFIIFCIGNLMNEYNVSDDNTYNDEENISEWDTWHSNNSVKEDNEIDQNISINEQAIRDMNDVLVHRDIMASFLPIYFAFVIIITIIITIFNSKIRSIF